MDTYLTLHPSPLTPSEDTICALATAPGGALGVIRVSGPDAFSVVSVLCSLDCSAAAASTLHFTRIVAPSAGNPTQSEIIDEVLVSVFRAPHSYTGEDTVEISCHGSSYILNKVLELLILQGCRMARPGEFTQRAFLNGKLDLSQAEAVADLIASGNRATHQIAMSQLRGHFSSQLKTMREQLLKLTTLLELELDFSDHEDLEFADRTELSDLAQAIEAHIDRLARTFQTGNALKQGIPVAIVGKTNVGKSTLLNRLVKDERAIVSSIHGTTRDTIEETMQIRGVLFRFIDTAGIRQTSDQIEQIGINRTYAAIEKARIILWLIDQAPTKAEVADITSRTEGRALIAVWNKTDLIAPGPLFQLHTSPIKISAKYNQGIEDLEQAIYEATDIPSSSEDAVIITSARHYDALLHAQESLHRVIKSLNQRLPADLVSEDLRQALDHLAEITGGQITSQETLNNIFSHFCVGK